MMPRVIVAVAMSAVVVVSACGGSDDDDAGPAVTGPTSTSELAAPTDPAPSVASVATTVTAATDTAPADPTVTSATTALATGGCPNGTWQLDAAGLAPFYAVAAPPEVTFTPSGRFVIEIGPETYQATAEGFSLDMMIAGGTSMVADVSGTVSGTVVDTGTTIEFVETSFDLDAAVTMDGAPMPNGTVLDAFRETFGTGSRPYECEDTNLVVTYATANGPATAVFTPA
jgi:hypothetical protein